jgi:hypothetical protein
MKVKKGVKPKKTVPRTLAQAVVDTIDLCMFDDHSAKDCKCHRRVEALIEARVKKAYWEGYGVALEHISMKADKYRKVYSSSKQ